MVLRKRLWQARLYTIGRQWKKRVQRKMSKSQAVAKTIGGVAAMTLIRLSVGAFRTGICRKCWGRPAYRSTIKKLQLRTRYGASTESRPNVRDYSCRSEAGIQESRRWYFATPMLRL